MGWWGEGFIAREGGGGGVGRRGMGRGGRAGVGGGKGRGAAEKWTPYTCTSDEAPLPHRSYCDPLGSPNKGFDVRSNLIALGGVHARASWPLIWTRRRTVSSRSLMKESFYICQRKKYMNVGKLYFVCPIHVAGCAFVPPPAYPNRCLLVVP